MSKTKLFKNQLLKLLSDYRKDKIDQLLVLPSHYKSWISLFSELSSEDSRLNTLSAASDNTALINTINEEVVEVYKMTLEIGYFLYNQIKEGILFTYHEDDLKYLELALEELTDRGILEKVYFKKNTNTYPYNPLLKTINDEPLPYTLKGIIFEENFNFYPFRIVWGKLPKLSKQITNELKAVSAFEILVLHENGKLFESNELKTTFNVKTVGQRGLFDMLRCLMQEQSKRGSSNKLVTENQLLEYVKYQKTFDFMYLNLNRKLKKTSYSVKKSGNGYMLVRKPQNSTNK